VTIGIGAGGYIGVAFETTPGTYNAPTKFFPITSEGLKYTQETTWRRPIRKTAAVIGGVKGNARIEGDVVMEALSTVAPYFHHASRATVAKTGAGPYVYTYTPSPAATAPNKTLSITVVRNGVAFGYLGCVVHGFSYSIENGMLQATYNILGNGEEEQTVPTPTFSATEAPFGAGSYTVENPTGSTVTDVDTFTFTVEDNGEAQYRLRNTADAKFIKFGEQNATMSMERDFEDRDEYDDWKALTNQGMQVTATNAEDDEISFGIVGGIREDYTVNLGGQGDLVRASVNMQGIADASGSVYTLAVTSTLNLT
jgi:hypothetical protein